MAAAPGGGMVEEVGVEEEVGDVPAGKGESCGTCSQESWF